VPRKKQSASINDTVIKSGVSLYEVGNGNIALNFNLVLDNTPSAKKIVYNTVQGFTKVLPDTKVVMLDINSVTSTEPIQQVDRDLLFVELKEIKEECSEGGWDTPNSRAISDAVLKMSREFIHLFPTSLHNPEITPENDGALGFEWRNRTSYFDAAITPEKVIYYIAKIKGRKSRGSFDFHPTKLPIVMMAFLDQLYSEE